MSQKGPDTTWNRFLQKSEVSMENLGFYTLRTCCPTSEYRSMSSNTNLPNTSARKGRNFIKPSSSMSKNCLTYWRLKKPKSINMLSIGAGLKRGKQNLKNSETICSGWSESCPSNLIANDPNQIKLNDFIWK